MGYLPSREAAVSRNDLVLGPRTERDDPVAFLPLVGATLDDAAEETRRHRVAFLRARSIGAVFDNRRVDPGWWKRSAASVCRVDERETCTAKASLKSVLTALRRVIGEVQRLGEDLTILEFGNLTLLEPEGLYADANEREGQREGGEALAGRLEAETDLVVDLADGLLGEDVSLVAVGNRHGWDESEGNKSESSSRDADAGQKVSSSNRTREKPVIDSPKWSPRAGDEAASTSCSFDNRRQRKST